MRSIDKGEIDWFSYRSLLAGGSILSLVLKKVWDLGMQWEEIFWVEGNSFSKVTKVRKYKVYGGNFKYSGWMQGSYS